MPTLFIYFKNVACEPGTGMMSGVFPLFLSIRFFFFSGSLSRNVEPAVLARLS